MEVHDRLNITLTPWTRNVQALFKRTAIEYCQNLALVLEFMWQFSLKLLRH